MGNSLHADVFYGFPLVLEENEYGEQEPPWETEGLPYVDDFESWFAYMHGLKYPGAVSGKGG